MPGETYDAPPSRDATGWQPAKGRVYKATGWYDEPRTIPTGLRLPPPVPPQRPAPVLPRTKGPWALTHLTTSLTGDILGGRGLPEEPGPEPRRTGRVVVLLLVGLGVLALLGALAVYLLRDVLAGVL